MARPYYIVYYERSVRISRTKPKEEDFPGARFAEGQLKTTGEVNARLRAIGRPAYYT